MKIVVPEFALSHFDATKHAPAIPGITAAQFELEINERLPIEIFPGYAPFCKLMWFENWTTAKLGIIPLDGEFAGFQPCIITRYEARRETELPVLTRFIPSEIVNVRAKYLCIVIYSAEQMKKEGSPISGDFAVVNILRTMTMVEPPLPPITMMRNALGVSEGGSGVPLDRAKYLESVAFWSKHIAASPLCQTTTDSKQN